MRIFRTVIMTVLLFAVLASVSCAEEMQEDDWHYVINADQTACITYYDGWGMEEVIIPQMIDGRFVTGIGDYAFYNERAGQSITLPATIMSIGRYAFSDNWDLQAFTIPDSVTSIGEYAFCNCVNLDSITIPASVSTMGEGICYGCDSLTTVVLSAGVTSIGDFAFAHCESLESILVPDSVSSIGNNPFFGSAPAIDLSMNQPYYAILDGSLVSKADQTLVSYISTDSADTYAIPEEILAIGNDAFRGNSDLSKVTIPDTVTQIGDHAFSECESLTAITIPDSVASMGANPFSSVYGAGFAVNVSENHLYLQSIDGVLFSKEDHRLIYYPVDRESDSYTVPDGTTTIGNSAFYGVDQLSTLTLPASVTDLEEEAFAYSGLTAVVIPDGINMISDGLFYNCNDLASVTLPNSVITIGDFAFDGCDQLKTIDIPDHVTHIGAFAFAFCDDLTSVKIPDSVGRLKKQVQQKVAQ